ncbi:hypothetical protein AA0474_1875 [Acetobacter lovaniensis NRIC 0474]|nr:hypothetical protein AA0474_1875 [Acetobacter lovaniensis NRIC 0474]
MSPVKFLAGGKEGRARGKLLSGLTDVFAYGYVGRGKVQQPVAHFHPFACNDAVCTCWQASAG